MQPYRYTELNPIRSGMVEQPLDYVWSSYPINALGKASVLCIPHPLYLALVSKTKEKQTSYRELFKHRIEGKLLEEIRVAVNKVMALGSVRFKAEVESLTAWRMTTKR